MIDDLDPRTRAWVGLAAAVACGCRSCFACHQGESADLDVTAAEIGAVVKLARGVRSSGERHMDEFVARRMSRVHPPSETVS